MNYFAYILIICFLLLIITMNIYGSFSYQFIAWGMSTVDIGRVSATVVSVLSAMGVGRLYAAGRWDVYSIYRGSVYNRRIDVVNSGCM